VFSYSTVAYNGSDDAIIQQLLNIKDLQMKI